MAVDRQNLSALLSSAGLVFLGGLLSSFSKLIERAIIGRWLSPEAYGEVSISLVIVSFGVTLALVGFNQGIPRYVSRFDDERNVRGIWVTGLALPGALSVVIAVAVFFNVGLLTGSLLEQTESTRLVQLFALAIPFIVGLRVGIGAIRGLENTVYKTYVKDLLYPGLRIVLLVVLLSLGVGILAPGYAYLVAAGVGFVVVHLFVNRLFSIVGGFRTRAREMIAFSAPLVISTIVSRLLTQTDTLMLGYFRSSYEVGLYSAAYPLAGAMIIVLSAFGYLYLPLASRLDAANDRGELKGVYRITCKWVYILTFPGFLVFLVFPSDVLSIVFTPEYRDAGIALSILAVGFFTSAAAGRNRETLSALGFTSSVLISNVIAFGLNVALNLFLIPRYGLIGASVASAVSYGALNLIVYLMLKRKCDITPFSSHTTRTFIVLPIFLIPPTVFASQWISLTLFTLPAFLFTAGFLTVAIVAISGCLQPEDEVAIEFVEGAIGRKVPALRRFISSSDD